MSRKRARGGRHAGPPTGPSGARGTPPNGRSKTGGDRRTLGWIFGGLFVAAGVLLGAMFVNGLPSGRATVAGGTSGTTVQGAGGTWTNIGPDALAAMMPAKDFTLLNVKTPYVGEIAGTDLYIPYTEVAARAAELPADRSAHIVVYCRSGNESAIAAQTLIDLGYTNIDNLDGGMVAWVTSGRGLVQVDRS